VVRDGGLARAVIASLVVVLGAHALAYFLVNVLPDAALVALGIQGANQEVLSTFRAGVEHRSYAESLLGVLRFDFGRTIDGVPVVDEIAQGALSSAPRVGIAALIALVTVLGVAFARRVPRLAISVVSFLPPYVIASLALLALLAAGQGGLDSAVVQLTAAVAIAVSPTALLAEQTAGITARNLASDFTRTMAAAGASHGFIRSKLLANLAAELAPSFDKALVVLLASLMFAEPILGLPGLGTTTVRAVRRADPGLLVGVTVFFAICVATTRVLAVLVRRRFGLSA
jgi:ABC-type dipeptide/oligopeptide/nickel transport system permease component